MNVAAALSSQPTPEANLVKQTTERADFPLLRTLTGLGVSGASPREEMLELEALQLSQSKVLEDLLADPDDPPKDPKQLRAIVEALASHPDASSALKEALGARLSRAVHPVALPSAMTPNDKPHIQHAICPDVPTAVSRILRIFAYDPSLEQNLRTLGINLAQVSVRYERLEPGPVGEYLEVFDIDPATDACYAPIDLDHPHLLMQNERAPSEGSAQFHQQMVYAVSMKTIEHFERALGRVAL